MRQSILKKLIPFALSAALVAYAPTASAADDHDHVHGKSLDARQHGYEHGYREGYHQGQEAKSSNAGPDYRSKDYKRGDVGYEAYMGSHDNYKKGFREGYESGYKDGYSGNTTRLSQVFGEYDQTADVNGSGMEALPQSDSGAGYARDRAYDVGYNDGLREGAKQRDAGSSYNPESASAFKSGDHGYRDAYGSKDDYKRTYREGFARGYRDGFGPQR